MVPEDLLIFRASITGRSLQPVSEAFVQLCPRAFEHALIGRVSNQGVAKGQGLFSEKAGRVLTNEFLSFQGDQGHPDLRTEFIGKQGGHRALGKDLPDDRGLFQGVPLHGVQPIESGVEQRGDGGWHVDGGEVAPTDQVPVVAHEQPLVDQHRHQLLHEQ